MLSGLGNPEACFLSGIKAFFMEHRGYNDLQRAAEGGHDAAAYLYAILLYRDNGGATTDDTAKGYMGGSRAAAVRCRRDGRATRGVCLCTRRPRVRSTTRLGAFGVNRYSLRH
jgi:TPR repeat protein